MLQAREDGEKTASNPQNASAQASLSPPPLALPKGGGAIRGMGEKLAATPVTGSASMTVPIFTSPGRSGFGPNLALSYDSGAGNGPFGFGWTLALPAITRKTDKGLPQYRDAEDSDVFILSGVEDLVPEFRKNAQGQWLREDGRYVIRETPRELNGRTYMVRRYRPRIESGFACIERWTRDDGDVHWRCLSSDNVLTIYGADAGSRIADPARPTRIFSWLISETRDDKGNAVVYTYSQEDDRQVDLARAHERNRTARGANRYLKRIRYGNRVPLLDADGARPLQLSAEALDNAGWMFEVVLDYGDHDETNPGPRDNEAVLPSGERRYPWRCRKDPFSSYRAGFEVRTYRLCRRVLMFHHFPGVEDVGADCLVRSTDFVYSEGRADGATYTFLLSARQTGYRRVEGGGYLAKSLPPLELEYSKPVVQDAVEELDPENLEHLPAGADGATWQWTDLHGEGIPGLLTEQGTGWFYRRNISPLFESQVKLAPLELVASRPNLTLARGDAQFMDLAGDGLPDLVVMDDPVPGLHEHDGREGWQPFRPFTSHPRRDLRDPNVRLIDLDGDGHADILVAEDDAFVWHASLAEEGFGPARRVARALDEEIGPRLLHGDATESIFLADMSGDGLTDLVRVRNGEVCYWPNLGYGRFGARVTMDWPDAPDAPKCFDAPDQFDPRRIRLADIDGSGTTDILYLHRDGVHLYFNESGNSLSAPRRLDVFPRVDNLADIVTTDLLGNGTACLVWSSSLPGDSRRQMRYVNLMGSVKPHLLVRAVNNLGVETRVKYSPSTKFYLQDKRAGTPWITRLPYPVHVVERVVVLDRVSGNRFVTRYSYHHGYFDGDEREFRGFGRVEQWDTEEIATFADDEDTLPTNFDAASFVPPVHTRTWYHTGACLERDAISRQFEQEYFREPGLSEEEARSLLLPDTVLPPLSAEEEREACRALKGRMLRQEVYAEDASPEDPPPADGSLPKWKVPYLVTEQNFTVRLEQPRGQGRHAVFFTHERETLAFHYERNASDPRVQHSMTLEVDEYGNVLRSASIAYGRRFDSQDESLQPADLLKQRLIHLTSTQNSFTNDCIDADAGLYRLRLPAESMTFEVRRAQEQTAPDGLTRIFALEDVRAFLSEAADGRHDVPYHDIDFRKAQDAVGAPDADASEAEKYFRRLIERVRTVYRANDLSRLLRPGQLESLALPGDRYKLAFTPELLGQVYRRDGVDLLPDPAEVLGKAAGDCGGYVDLDEDGCWWTAEGTVFYSPDASDSPAGERSFALRHFFLPHRYRDPFGGTTHVFYDSSEVEPLENFNLLVVRREDAAGNSTSVVNDYRTLHPRRVTDPNGNRTEVRFDVLGMVVGTALMGKETGPEEGDSFTVFEADLDADELAEWRAAADPYPLAAAHLGTATTRVIYDLSQVPACAVTISRHTHVSDLGPGAQTSLSLTFIYSDGFGREVQKKIQAESGPVPLRDATGSILVGDDGLPRMSDNDAARRWIGSGWTIYNNKGKPVRQFEPFFTDTHRFERDVRIGVSPWTFYDPLQRVVAVLYPDHGWEKTVFDAWQQATFDRNDTLPRSGGHVDPRKDGDVGGFFRRLNESEFLPGWYELRKDPSQQQAFELRFPDAKDRASEMAAAEKAERHAGTPTLAHLDALGRPFVTLLDNGPDPERPEKHLRFAHRVELDVEGNQRAVRDPVVSAGDPLGRIVMVCAYDMLGSCIHQVSMDAGPRWMLNDVAGERIRAWDGRGHTFRTDYDALRRKRRVFVRSSLPGAPPTEFLAERLVYGEQHPEGALRNLRGKLYLHLDQSGATSNESCDFKGNVLRASRRLAAEIRMAVDWSSVDAESAGVPDDARSAFDAMALESVIAQELEAGGYENRTRYDALNRTIQEIAPHPVSEGAKVHVIQPTYNEASLLERVDIWLDLPQEPDGLLDPATSGFRAVLNVDYDARGRRLRIDYGNRVSTFYDYDPQTSLLRRLVTRRNPQAFPGDCPSPPPPDWPGCGLQNLRYTYDPAGNLTHVRDDAQQTIYFRNRRVDASNEYTYDALYRLIRATGREHLGQAGVAVPHSYNDAPRSRRLSSDGSGRFAPNDGAAMGRYVEEFSYDAVGNMAQMKHRRADAELPDWTRSYFYDAPSQIENGIDGALPKTGNRLTRTRVNGGVFESYSYDVHGNTLGMPQLQAMQWGHDDRLRMTQRQKVNDDDQDGIERHGERTWYVYDASGHRVRKVTERANGGGIKEERIYLGHVEIYRRSFGPEAGLTRETLHVVDDKRCIALVETRNEIDDGSPKRLIRYRLGNHLGSAVLELDDRAEIISYEEYSPFGSTSCQAVRSLTETPIRYRYTSRERDEESGLSYHGARYYAPWLARWTSADPAGLVDGPNVFRYVQCNPVKLVDINGMSPTLSDVNENLERLSRFGTIIMGPSAIGARSLGKALGDTMATYIKDEKAGEKKLEELGEDLIVSNIPVVGSVQTVRAGVQETRESIEKGNAAQSTLSAAGHYVDAGLTILETTTLIVGDAVSLGAGGGKLYAKAANRTPRVSQMRHRTGRHAPASDAGNAKEVPPPKEPPKLPEDSAVKRPEGVEARAAWIHDRYGESIVNDRLNPQEFRPNNDSKLGARVADHFDRDSKTLYEFNTTPWSELPADQRAEKIRRKLEQIGHDISLLEKGDIERAVWYGTEPLPPELQRAMNWPGLEFHQVPLPEHLQHLRVPVR